jgi:hypothetical protein
MFVQGHLLGDLPVQRQQRRLLTLDWEDGLQNNFRLWLPQLKMSKKVTFFVVGQLVLSYWLTL